MILGQKVNIIASDRQLTLGTAACQTMQRLNVSGQQTDKGIFVGGLQAEIQLLKNRT